jgi:hypothetical protein
MSIFRNDAEMIPDPARRAQLRGVEALLRDSLPVDPAVISRARERVRSRLDQSLSGSGQRTISRRSWWDRGVTLPMPVAVAAAAALVMMIGAALLAAGPGLMPGRSDVASVAERARAAETLNLQVQVDIAETEELLRWLNRQEALETVTIQLPESAQFQLRGEPVLLRPNAPAESSSRDDEFVIVPLEDAQE